MSSRIPSTSLHGLQRVRDTYDLKYEAAVGRRLLLWEDATMGERLHVEIGPRVDTQHWSDYLKRRLGAEDSYFRRKLVLDAGCGLGWAAYGAAKLGATAVGIDLSRSAAKFSHNLLRGLDAYILICDVRYLPFRKEIFDLVMSLGVLHHTPNTRESFINLARHVREGGELFVYIYEWHNPYKLFVTFLLRKLLQLFSVESQYALAKKLVTIQNLSNQHSFFSKLYSNPAARYFVIFAFDPLALLDFLSPRYNHVHLAHEVLTWYRESGFGTARILNPSFKYKVPFGSFLWGKHGGGLYVGGTRRKATATAQHEK